MKENTLPIAVSFLISLMATILILFVSQASAAEKVTIEGTIQGYNCITTGKICPADKNDPWLETENVLALYTKGGDFYLVSNMNRDALKGHTNEVVRITGKVDPKYKSMSASRLEVLNEGAWEKSWPSFRIGSGGMPNFH